MRNHVSQVTKPSRIALFTLLAVFFTSTSSFVFAQNSEEQKWWFTVELIAFKRDITSSNSEDFSEADFVLSNNDALDLFSLPIVNSLRALDNYIVNLPTCQAKQVPLINTLLPLPTLNLALNEPEPSLLPLSAYVDDSANIELEQFHLLCVSNIEKASLNELKNPITEVPVEILSPQPYFIDYPHLVDETALSLSDYAAKIFRQRDITPLLHTAWRQEVVFGKDEADFVRIRAGELLDASINEVIESSLYLAEQATASDELEANDNFFQELNEDLNALADVDWLAISNAQENKQQVNQTQNKKWSLDGIFKVYLENVNQVPYLHVESELKHHRLSLNSEGNPELDTYPFKQRRRIISKQIHYFDHPAFGLVIRLERFEVPVPTVSLEEILEP